MGKGKASVHAAIASLAVPFVVGLLALGASGLTINITAPLNATWTARDTIDVSGTAAAPSPDRELLDTTADFAGGTEINVSTAAGSVALQGSPSEMFRYLQDFSGLTGSASIDDHWMWNLSGTQWQVSNNGAYSAAPPSLSHSGATAQVVYWNTMLAGPFLEGRVAFSYFCEANATLDLWASTWGSPVNRTSLLAAGGPTSGTLDYNLTALFPGSRSLFFALEVGASAATDSVCAIDNFAVDALQDVSQGDWWNITFMDNFTNGGNTSWHANDGYFQVGGSNSTSDTPPALYHTAISTTSVWSNWATASPIQMLLIRFHYQCEVNGALQAFVSYNGVTETRILNSARGAGHTTFSYDASPIVFGHNATYLRFASDGSTVTSYSCGVDDVILEWRVTGYMSIPYSGSYTTRSVDLGSPATLTTADWVASVAPGTNLIVNFRSSQNNVSFTSWAALPLSTGSSVAGSARYFQFRVDFGTYGPRPLPSLDRLGLNFNAIARVEVSVNGGPWMLANGTSPWNGTVPLAGGSNNITARVTDSTGATSQSVVLVLRDTFPPAAPGVPAGPAVTNQTSATWTWTAATDVGLGVDHYLVDVGLTAGGIELGAGLIANGLSFTKTGLPDNVRVYATVWAVDAAGLVSLAGSSSSATLVDRTPPGAPAIRPVVPFVRGGGITWSWTAATEAGSGVTAYVVRIGSTAGAGDFASAITSDLNYTYGAGISGSAYYLSVAALDNAGNTGVFSTASAVTVDDAPPSNPALTTVPPTMTNNTALSWTWSASSDGLSGVDHYLIQLGTSPGASDVESLLWAGTTYTASSVEPGARYFFEVRAVDGAGNEGAAAVAGAVLVDTQSPNAPVADAVAAYWAGASINIKWNASADQPTLNASGVDHYVVRVSDGTDVTVSQIAGLDVDLAVADGTHYTISVSAVDAAGNEGAAASLSFTSDRSGPSAPTGLKVVLSQPAGPTFQASWNGTSDTGSGVKEYRISIGTTPGGTEVANGRIVTGTSDKWTGQFGKTYYVTVWAVDNLGNAGPSAAFAEGISAQPPGSNPGGGTPGPGAFAAALAVLGAALVVRARRRT